MTVSVAAVMSSPVVTARPSMTIASCLDLMRMKHIGALPVLGADARLAGVLSERDALRHPHGTAADVMIADVTTIGPDASMAAAARLMIRRDVTHVPVLDQANRLVGIVTRGDLLRVFLRSDDSIRKEISNGLLRELPLLGRGRIKVEVSDGVVRLHGEVESTALTGLLLRLVAAVPGVAGVENDLHQQEMVESAAHG